MTRRNPVPTTVFCALVAAATAAHAQDDLEQARRAFQQHEYPAVIDILLPQEQAGQLDKAEPLMWLALACEQAKLPPRNRPHDCFKRRAEIMVKAAELGNPHAMFGASIGLMDTGAGRIGLRLPFLDDGKRVDALMWAALAANFATDDDLRAKASARAAQLARPLSQEWRGQETLGQRAMRMAEAKRVAFESRGLAAYGQHAASAGNDFDDDDEYGAGDDYNMHVHEPGVMDCGATPLRPGGSLQVKLGAGRHAKSFSRAPLTELSIWREGADNNAHFVLSLGDHDPGLLHVTPQQLSKASHLNIPANLQAIAWGHMAQKRPVFTRPGTYTLYLTSALESGDGGYICSIEYRG
ncbi:hypothetical protein FQY83_10420 [Luteimonas marina]|uniref:Sel1 repeat family protein n=1 Tax=Luteimonas marina TaxID=488485 RepID=A0A5C5U3I3_9GAMM|nr:hypothetical protein [Luteimonas marina]TWT20152.1 hypothetical protein FQY83_10420 [Luteimonas marina]